MAAGVGVGRDDRDRGTVGQGVAEVGLGAIHHRGDSSLGQAASDRFRQGGGSGTRGE